MNQVWTIVNHEVKLHTGYVVEPLSASEARIRRADPDRATRAFHVDDKEPLPQSDDGEFVVHCRCRRGRGGCRLEISLDYRSLSCVPMTGSRCSDCEAIVEKAG